MQRADELEVENTPFFEDKSEVRFEDARNGDHFMCPFQCDLCHFRNIQKRDPVSDTTDALLKVFIRRANLDALWAREPGTVYGNLRERRRALQGAARLGIADPHPFARGPFPVEDTMGMAMACTILERSLDPGRNSDTIEYDTLRKQRAYYSNYVHSSAIGMGPATLAGEKGKQFFTNSPTYGMWFERFMLGCHKRMGDVTCQDRALTIHEALAIQALLEQDWKDVSACAPSSARSAKQFEIALMGMAVTNGFSAALRGEEIPKSDLEGCLKYRAQSGSIQGRNRREALLGAAGGRDRVRNKQWLVVRQSD